MFPVNENNEGCADSHSPRSLFNKRPRTLGNGEHSLQMASDRGIVGILIICQLFELFAGAQAMFSWMLDVLLVFRPASKYLLVLNFRAFLSFINLLVSLIL